MQEQKVFKGTILAKHMKHMKRFWVLAKYVRDDKEVPKVWF